MSQTIEPWYIGVVADNKDPEKRRRLKIRGPNESEESVPTKSLPWINCFVNSKDELQLPEESENVLVLMFGKLKLWREVPDSDSWSEFSNEDYPTAYKNAHKNAYNKTYRKSGGWKILYTGNIDYTDDSEKTVKTKKSIETDILSDKVTISQDKLTLETDGTNIRLTANNVIVETDGTRISVKNGSQNLADILKELMNVIKTETHMTPTGPSAPPMPTTLAKYTLIQNKLNSLLY
jgi:hypothetical protein